jgi:high affinity Mn2+ porin
LRYASVAEPKVANGLRFDRRLFRDRGDMFEAEKRYSIGQHAGAVRALGFLLHTNSGSYQQALNLAHATGTTPDVTATRQVGTLKYGGGLNFEQEITRDVGVFSRLGWNDGRTESFAFTAIDRLAQGGVSVTGTRWHRHYDAVGSAVTASGLSSVHAQYLAAGGLDFLIGDGRLNYAPEYVWESYYSARVVPGFFTSLDAQRIANPAYNQDRGPVWAFSLRLHIEVGR